MVTPHQRSAPLDCSDQPEGENPPDQSRKREADYTFPACSDGDGDGHDISDEPSRGREEAEFNPTRPIGKGLDGDKDPGR